MRRLDFLRLGFFYLTKYFCLVFASKINIANLDSETLLLCFQDLRQVQRINLIRLINSLLYFSYSILLWINNGQCFLINMGIQTRHLHVLIHI